MKPDNLLSGCEVFPEAKGVAVDDSLFHFLEIVVCQAEEAGHPAGASSGSPAGATPSVVTFSKVSRALRSSSESSSVSVAPW